MRFPLLIRLVHGIGYLFQLRKWYVMRHWKKLLKEASPSFTALDFGGGESQYLIPFLQKYPLARFYNIDQLESNISFTTKYPADNLIGILMDFEKIGAPILGDVALCVGVLHYIEDDDAALKHIYESLLPRGKFLLYTPISPSMQQPESSAYPDYDRIHIVKHYYSQQTILEKLKQQGFQIVKTVTCYGYFGQRVHRIVKALQTRIYYGNWILKLICLIGLIAFFPFQLLGMMIDFYTSHKSGSGFLVVAVK